MKIQYCSDLHLEFPENRKLMIRNPLRPAGGILVLAGDIVVDKPSPLWEKKRNNFYLVNNKSIAHEEVRFVFSTLWSRISPDREWDIQKSVADFSARKFRRSLLDIRPSSCERTWFQDWWDENAYEPTRLVHRREHGSFRREAVIEV